MDFDGIPSWYKWYLRLQGAALLILMAIVAAVLWGVAQLALGLAAIARYGTRGALRRGMARGLQAAARGASAGVSWTRRWARLWVAWLIITLGSFLALEAVGLGCEFMGIPGCSTASAWMASNWGPVLLCVATGAAAGVASWHWFDCQWRQRGWKARWIVIGPAILLFWLGYAAFVFVLARYGVEHP